MNKEFRVIPGFEPYEISIDGHLRYKGKILSTPISSIGYKRKYLKALKKNLLIHRAIALAFIANPNNFREVNHINAIKSDNSIDNLEWTTRKGNAEHASKMGLFTGYNGKQTKLTALQVSIIREALKLGHTQKRISNYFRLHQSTISLIKSNINWQC